MKNEIAEIGLKLATALLLHNREVSLRDIRAMPFFEHPEEAEAVINALQESYQVEIYAKKVASLPVLEWDEIMILKGHDISLPVP